MILNNNAISKQLYSPYVRTLGNLNRSATRLATGKKHASGSDGTGDLGVALRMKMNVQGTKTLFSGMQNALGLANSQDEVLGDVGDIITRMQELAAAAVDPTKSQANRNALQQELTQLNAEVIAVAANTQYNEGAMFGTTRTLRIGMETGETMSLSSINLAGLTFAAMSISSVGGASAAIISLRSRANSLTQLRTRSRGHAARLERTIAYTQEYVAQLSNAESAIVDIDVAQETAEFIKNQVIVSSAQSVITQANGMTQGALQFLSNI
jgi:flagellin